MREKTHKNIHLFALILIVLSISVSEYVTSIGIWVLVTNWILDFRYKDKWERLKNNKGIAVFLILYLIHLIWLLNTSNFSFALNDLRIKLPLLIFPIIIGTTEPITHKQLLIIFKFMFLGLIISSVSGLLAYYEIIGNYEINNFRQISIFISHIRLSLLLCLAVFIILYILKNKYYKNPKEGLALAITCLWFFVFLFIIQAFTGLFIFIFIIYIILIYFSIRETKIARRVLYLISLVLIPLSIGIYLGLFLNSFYTPHNSHYSTGDFTSRGNIYYSNNESRLIENGNLIYHNICEKELREEWEKRSNTSLDSLTESGTKFIHNVIRYLTSKGLNKDADGIIALRDADILAIESGSTNYKYNGNSFINKRLYSIIWQLDVYSKGGNPSGHSITQRFEYIKAALILAQRNFFTGTGTGDIDDAYKTHYVTSRSILDPDFRHRAHNQYLTFFISFGVFGAFLCFLAIFFPVYLAEGYNRYYFIIFFIIAIISMINEDTLETMTGVVFISFFYSLLLWGYKPYKK